MPTPSSSKSRKERSKNDSGSNRSSSRNSNDNYNFKHMSTPFWKRLLFPYESACYVLSDVELKEAIVLFSQQTGVVFTLLASISAGGLFLEALVGAETKAAATAAAHDAISISAAVSPSPSTTGAEIADFSWSHKFTITHVLNTMLGMGNCQPILLQAATPCFCASTFLNLYGLVNTTNVLGRAQIIPTSHIKDYIRQNTYIVHSTYWTLIPAISIFGVGVICTVDHLHGEPQTTFAFICSAIVGMTQTYSLITLGKYTESIKLRNEYDEKTR